MKSPRLRWQFSLRAMLLAALILPPLLGWLGLQTQRIYLSWNAEAPQTMDGIPFPFSGPFPLGTNSDAFWDTEPSVVEAADFIFYDHEFAGETAQLTPVAKRHLEEVALRLPHVEFPVVIEQTNSNPELDAARRKTIMISLSRLGAPVSEERVVIADAFAKGFRSVDGAGT